MFIRATITDDNCFSATLKKYWDVEENADLVATKKDLRDIIKMLRFKLITSTTGTDDEYLMKKNIRNAVFSNKVGKAQ